MAEDTMSALSVRQPYADQIMRGEKQFEYRNQITHKRGRVYIYGSSAIFVKASYKSICEHMTRFRSKSKFARPYICRLMNLRRLTCPSTCPLLHSFSNAARTAA